MALPKGTIIQLRKKDPLFVVYFLRRDNPRDHGGYYCYDFNQIKSVKLRDLDSFKVRPRRWGDLKQLRLRGMLKVSR